MRRERKQKSEFIQKCQKYLNNDIILQKKENIESLYFKNSTELHQKDDIVKQSFGKWLKNLNNFKGNKSGIIDGLKEFCSKYHFVVPKKDGKTQVGTFGKRIGDYIVLLKCDMQALDKMKTGIFKQNTLKATVNVKESDGENDVQGFEGKQITIKPTYTGDQIAKEINKVFGAKLGIEVNTDAPSKGGSEEGSKKKNKEGREKEDGGDQKPRKKSPPSDQNFAPTNRQGVPIQGFQPQTIYPIGAQGFISSMGGIPITAFQNPGQMGQIIQINVNNNPDLDDEQKKKILTKIKNQGIIKTLTSAINKLQSNEKVWAAWQKVLYSHKQVTELSISVES